MTLGRGMRAIWLIAAIAALNAVLVLVLIPGISQRLTTSATLTVAAAVLFLFHPGTLVAETRGGVELLFILLLLLSMLMMYRAIEGGHKLDFAVSGAILGAAVMVKSTPLLFPLVLLVYLLITGTTGARGTAAGRV